MHEDMISDTDLMLTLAIGQRVFQRRMKDGKIGQPAIVETKGKAVSRYWHHSQFDLGSLEWLAANVSRPEFQAVVDQRKRWAAWDVCFNVNPQATRPYRQVGV